MRELNPRLSNWLAHFGGLSGWGPLGRLEYAILTVLWAQSPQTARHPQEYFPDAAYTTLMTTLDRLYKKGLRFRERNARANAIGPR